MVPQINNYYEFTQHVLKCFPEEACGFVINGMFVPADNIADDREHNFKISSEQYVRAVKTGQLEAIVHSHTNPLGVKDRRGRFYDARTPSMSDLQGYKDTNITWGIVSTEGENVSEVLWFGMKEPAALEGRTFIHNVYDCFTLVRDYYIIHKGVIMDVYPRPVNWEEYDKNIYERYCTSEGFERINNPEPDDVIFFHVLTRNYIDHAGIYLGEDKFLHHQQNRLSCIDSLSRWHKHIAYYLRYTGKK